VIKNTKFWDEVLKHTLKPLLQKLHIAVIAIARVYSKFLVF